MKDRWVKLGVVGVDSGQLMVCDPCYIDSEWSKENFDTKKKSKTSFSYAKICELTMKDDKGGQLKYKKGHPGVAVAFSSGIGDGLYEVHARIGTIGQWGTRIKEVRIIMDEER